METLRLSCFLCSVIQLLVPDLQCERRNSRELEPYDGADDAGSWRYTTAALANVKGVTD